MKLVSTLAALILSTSALAQNAPSPKLVAKAVPPPKPTAQTASPSKPGATVAPSAKLIAQLDAASKNFKNAQANVSKDVFEYIVKDHTLTTGSIFIERAGSVATMGATIFPENSKTPANIISFDGNTLQNYTTSSKTVEVFRAGANQAKYQSFLTLGFGGSGSDLLKAWNVNDLGTETIDSVICEKLDLTPKDNSVSSTFTHITIWIDPTRDVSLKQVFYAPTKNTQTATYTDIKLNKSINKDLYKIPAKAAKSFH